MKEKELDESLFQNYPVSVETRKKIDELRQTNLFRLAITEQILKIGIRPTEDKPDNELSKRLSEIHALAKLLK